MTRDDLTHPVAAAATTLVESLQYHCIHTISTGPVVHLFASRNDGHAFKPPGGTYVKPGISC
jgi:hypothetical protein